MTEALSTLERKEIRKELEQSATVKLVTHTTHTITIYFENHIEGIRTHHYEKIVGDKLEISHIDYEKKKLEFTLKD